MKIVLCANTDWFLYQYNRELCDTLVRRGDDLTLVSPAGKYSQLLEAEGFKHRHWSVCRAGVMPWTELDSVHSLGRIFEDVQPRLVHNFTLKSALYGSLAARQCDDAVVVNSITGLGWTFSSRELRARLLRPVVLSLAKRALRGTLSIFLNRADRELLIRKSSVARESTELILSSGVDIERYTTEGYPSGPPIAVFVGRMLWNKGAGVFVDAARILRSEGLDVRFRLVGSPDPANPDSIPESALREWSDEGVVEWVPFLEEMPSVYREASIVCLPSAYGEGVPTVLLEGGAASRALVAADNPGSREIIRDGETGLLVRPEDPSDLAAALRKLVRSSELREQLGAAARRRVEQRFRVEDVVARTLKVYGRALGENVVPGPTPSRSAAAETAEVAAGLSRVGTGLDGGPG